MKQKNPGRKAQCIKVDTQKAFLANGSVWSPSIHGEIVV